MSYQVVSVKADVEKLAKGLLDKGRKKPWCLVSHTAQTPRSFLNLDKLVGSVGEISEIYLIENGDLTYFLSDLLPERTGIYGDACRVYPIGFNESTDTFEVPRYLLDISNANRCQTDIENDVWRLADLVPYKKQRDKRSKAVDAVVMKVFPPSLALVKLSNDQMASLRQETCFPGIPIEWLIEEGDKLSGTWDEVNDDFIPNGTKLTLKDLVALYGLGNVILGMVKTAERQIGSITIYPGVDIKITRDEISGNDRDLVTDFLDPGDIVQVRLYKDPQGRIGLRMDDIDDDEVPLPAPPIIDGGGPWLIDGRDDMIDIVISVEDSEEVSEPSSVPIEEVVELPPVQAIPSPGVVAGAIPASSYEKALSGKERSDLQFQVSFLNGRVRDLEARLGARENDVLQVSGELRETEEKLAAANSRYTEERKKNTASRRQSARIDTGRSTTESRRNRWKTDADWFNEELRRAWIGRYKPEDRDVFVLDVSKVSYGDNFFETLRENHISEEDLRKVVRVVLDIVTDRNGRDLMHEVHPLRESASASAKNLTREDGAVCFRAYLEQNTAQAKRLHFWKLQGGWELSRVGLHDDMRA